MVLSLLQRKCFNFERKTDRGWSWIVMTSAFIMMLLFDGTLSSYGIIKSELLNDTQIASMNYTRSIFTYPGTTSVCVFLCATLFGSILMAYIGLLFTGLLGSLFIFTGIFATSYMTNLYIWIFLYGVVSGVGQGFVLLVAISSVNIYFDRFRGIASGVSMSGAGFGCIVVPYLLNQLIKAYGFWLALRYFAVISFVTNTLCSLVMLQMTDSNYYAEKSMKEADLTENVEALLNEAASEILKAKEDQYPESSKFDSHKNRRKTSRMSSITSNPYMSRIFTTIQSVNQPPQDGEQQNWGTFSDIKRSYPIREHRPSRIMENGNRLSVDLFYSSSIRSLQIITNKSQTTRVGLGMINEDREAEDIPEETLTQKFRKIFTCPEFYFIAIINSGFMSGYIVPFYYLEPYSASYVTRERIINVFQCIGIMNALGRLFGGLMGNIACVNLVLLSMTCFLICAMNHFVFVHLPINLFSVATYGAIHGFFIGVPSTLNTLIIVQYLGLENLTYSFGIINIIKAFSGILGSITIEHLITLKDSTSQAFIYYAICLAVAGLSHIGIILMRFIKKTQNK